MKKANKIKINFYIDGNYTYHIHDYLSRKYKKTIDWKNFQAYLKNFVEKLEDNAENIVIESKYFVGTKSYTTEQERSFLYNTMEHAHITKVANQLRENGKFGLKEAAVDVSLAVSAVSDYYKARDEDRFDCFMLMAGDSDFVPLLAEMKRNNVKTVVIYFDFEYNGSVTKAGQFLLEEADYRINFETIVNERVDETIKQVLYEHTIKPDEFKIPVLSPELAAEEPATVEVDGVNVSFKEVFAAMDKCTHLQYGYVYGDELIRQMQTDLGVDVRSQIGEILTLFQSMVEAEYEPTLRVRLRPEVYKRMI